MIKGKILALITGVLFCTAGLLISQQSKAPDYTFVPKGWTPHEGGILKYAVDIRFGQEPETMPDGWYFGRSARFGDKEEMKGPYNSIDSVTLVIARHLKRF